LAARHAERAGPIEPSFPDPLVRGVGELADGLGVDLRRGDAALLSGDAEAAVAAYRLAVERSPDSASARHSLAASLAEAGRLEDSVAEFRRALEIEPRNPILLSGLATILFELGRREESLAEIERAVEIDPGSVDLQLRLASTYEATGDWAAALAGYDRVLEMDPARHDAALGRGLALARLGRGGEAVAALESVVAADPGRLDARFGLANLLAAEDRYLDAVPHYRAILERDAANLDVRLLEASALVLGGSYGEARDRLEEAMAVLPEESEVAHSLALLLASCPTSEVCEPERALGLAQGALDAEASLERAETVAIALAATGRWGEAVPWQEDLVAQAETLGAEGLLPRLRANLERYRAGRRALPPWQGGS
ncbi:MAG: tetratricopeptide repeat protein, partial [Thermoanaerobaculia bacterium]|nr:tetratricopeptide repeat protein [Thermoanaerobaculia bacterium]